MKVIRKNIFLLISTVSALSAFSQSREMQILSSFGAPASNNPLDYVVSSTPPTANQTPQQGSAIGALSATQQTGGTLAVTPDNPLTATLAVIERKQKTADPLDFVMNTTIDNKTLVANGLGVLTSISQAPTNKRYNATGSWGQSEHFISTPLAPSMMGSQLYLPGKGRISSGFGYRAMDSKVHKGIDIAMPVGDTVRVVMPGVIESISYEHKGYGKYVTVKHDNGMQTRYAHLSNSLVTSGQRVDGNQPIALSGNTGKTTGPHLHFEIRYLGQAIDPTSVIDFNSTLTPIGNRSFNRRNADGGTGGSHLSANSKQTSTKRTYVVRWGDTIEDIAARFGTTVMKLTQLNNLNTADGTTIQPGQMLIVR